MVGATPERLRLQAWIRCLTRRGECCRVNLLSSTWSLNSIVVERFARPIRGIAVFPWGREITLWQIGTVIRGKYRILARLGEGGMATVYKAHHELLDELRALKVIKPELASDPEFMGRFKNEAIMARRLTHPNAVRVDDLD